MSLEKEKYGITEISVEDIELQEDYKYNWRIGNYTEKNLLWKHDTMNIFQARELAFNFQNCYIYEFPMDCWQLHGPSTNAGRKLTLDETRTMTKVQGVVNRQSFQDTFLKKYIEKKLSYNPKF